MKTLEEKKSKQHIQTFHMSTVSVCFFASYFFYAFLIFYISGFYFYFVFFAASWTRALFFKHKIFASVFSPSIFASAVFRDKSLANEWCCCCWPSVFWRVVIGCSRQLLVSHSTTRTSSTRTAVKRAASTIRHQCKNSTKSNVAGKKSETIYFWGLTKRWTRK